MQYYYGVTGLGRFTLFVLDKCALINLASPQNNIDCDRTIVLAQVTATLCDTHADSTTLQV